MLIPLKNILYLCRVLISSCDISTGNVSTADFLSCPRITSDREPFPPIILRTHLFTSYIWFTWRRVRPVVRYLWWTRLHSFYRCCMSHLHQINWAFYAPDQSPCVKKMHAFHPKTWDQIQKKLLSSNKIWMFKMLRMHKFTHDSFVRPDYHGSVHLQAYAPLVSWHASIYIIHIYWN